ncbi:hypothetical protein Q0601_05295 [Paracoccus onubensis]|uniref:hypothetical protein n=1 Tax=Paracoccus onubensis TaxID=1675788 RepID=UPI002730E935|nr:hypothetical protein [Paracoccus onubensis]MDP0926575.1 hypothetical protein [Paracoccus onubensis]
MTESDEDQIVANLAKAMAMICVRNTKLEDLHAGPVPVSRTGDYSDVVVLDGAGNRIPWTQVSLLDDDEMRDLMRQVVNRLYTFHLRLDDPDFQHVITRWLSAARRWDEPEPDPGLMGKGDIHHQ